MRELPLYRTPTSTYRLQFTRDFRFADAAALAPYLCALGISECYASPILAARPGSPHGYDVCDHSRLNPDLGTENDFHNFCAALRAQNLGLIVDFVPNHMSNDTRHNRWWRDVLANGPSSAFSKYFDIDWDPVKRELKNRILLPVLGDQYGAVLESGQFRIVYENGHFSLDYFDKNLPLNPRQVRMLLRHEVDSLRARFSEDDDADLREYLSILFELDHTPPYTVTDPQAMKDRAREIEVARQRLAILISHSAIVRSHVQKNIDCFNGVCGDPKSFDLLHELLESQVYRLSYWRTAMHEINYRRFFDINELAGLRMEDPEVFEATHTLAVRLVKEGLVHGFRLDHVDGLYNPSEYFLRLQKACTDGSRRIYLVVEKILSENESLQHDWEVDGTTGYDFLNLLNGVFIDRSRERDFRRFYSRFTGAGKAFADVVYESKKLIIASSMASELNVLAHELNRMSEEDRRCRDFTLISLQEALREIVACFPVYRTYLKDDGSVANREALDHAVRAALRRNPAMESSIFEFIRSRLLPSREQCRSEDDFQRRVRFARKFQQYTGPVQAKGLEDTAFYRYCPLASLNEVGGEPPRFGRSVDEFHRANQERLKAWPLAMITTATHDTKRGEDARARMNVLSELFEPWRTRVSLWSSIHAGLCTEVNGHPAPDRADQYLFYQALLGAWPAEGMDEPGQEFIERMRRYMEKATKEAKVHTSWINPSNDYDAAVARFVTQVLTRPASRRFLRTFRPFQLRVAFLGAINSLAQVALKVAAPGVPDFYQGCEMWDLSLVDPDNRRPVDFDRRRRALESLLPLLEGRLPENERSLVLEDLLAKWPDGRIKLLVTAAGLRIRRANPELFLHGDYVPLYANGDRARHVISFARRIDNRALIVAVPRLCAGLVHGQSWPLGEKVWTNTELAAPDELAGASLRNIFTGETVTSPLSAARLFSQFPVALLVTPSVAGAP